jgi:hypothetical protein
MATTTSIERERAMAWIAKRLRWERTLADLRADRDDDADVERKAA